MKPIPTIDEKALKASEKAHHDVLANDEPLVLESSDSDPEFPALEEFEVDADGPKGSTARHPGLLWIVIAIVLVVLLCVVFALVGDWR